MATSLISGVYLITNLENGKVYVGSSVNTTRRLNGHKAVIKLHKHPNKHLQAAIDKYGVNNFSFEVWERCPLQLLREREKYWIDSFDATSRTVGYNTAIDTECPGRGIKQSKECIEQRAASNKKHRKFVDPNGVIFETKDTKKFAAEHNLNYNSLTALANTHNLSNKGWRLATPNTIGVKVVVNTYTLVNPEGQQIMTNNIADFCVINKLYAGLLHKVISKKQLQHKGWRLAIPDNIGVKVRVRNNITKKYTLVNPEGQQIIINGIHKFCKENHLSAGPLSQVISGKQLQHKGWRLAIPDNIGVKFDAHAPGMPRVKMAETQKKTYTIINPTGELITFRGLKDFCRNNNLDNSSIHRVISGKRLQHRGYKKAI